MEDLVAGLPEGPTLTPAVTVLNRGLNRFGFALSDRARKQLGGAEAAIYTAPMHGGAVRGPFVARSETLSVASAFRSQTTEEDAAAPKWLYVSDVDFRHGGSQRVIALARLDGRLVASSPFNVRIGPAEQPPLVGEKAIRVHTPTVTSVGGDLAAIDTRMPPLPGLHLVDLYDVLGHKPVVLAFASPKLCRPTHVCGPVIDIVAQAQAAFSPKGVDFIHMEIYNDNRVIEGYRPQVRDWRLPGEPWTFVIDRRGRIAARFEGALSARELDHAIDRVLDRRN